MTPQTRFFLKKGKDKNYGIIHLLYTVDGFKVKFTTGMRMYINQWDSGYPKKIPETLNIRNILEDYRNKMDRFILSTVLKTGSSPDVNLLRGAFRKIREYGYITNMDDNLIDVVDKPDSPIKIGDMVKWSGYYLDKLIYCDVVFDREDLSRKMISELIRSGSYTTKFQSGINRVVKFCEDITDEIFFELDNGKIFEYNDKNLKKVDEDQLDII
jgi:hypothetical protein